MGKKHEHDPTPYACPAGDGTLIRGTGGSHDYLIFGRVGDAVVSIKPMMGMNDASTVFAFRIRCVLLPLVTPAGPVEGVENVITMAPAGTHEHDAIGEMLEAFPNFPWTQKDGTRCSLMLQMAPIPAGYKELEKVKAWMSEKGFIDKTIDALRKGLGDETPLIGRATLRHFLESFYAGQFEEIEQATAPKPEPEPVALEDTNVVIKFPGQDVPEETNPAPDLNETGEEWDADSDEVDPLA